MREKGNRFRQFLADIYYLVKTLLIFIKGQIFRTKYNDNNLDQIPVIINNRNRYTYLLELIDFLEKSQCKNIIILDNDSTYPPLLEYYKNTPHKVIHLGRNMGYMALEHSVLWKSIRNDYFVYTDPDVVPIRECPKDFMKHFFYVLKKSPLITKIGFSLKIDDLPDCYSKKDEVIKWESRYFKASKYPDFYDAKIDTTFALHRPWSYISSKGQYKHFRSVYPYEARHMPWYENTSNPTQENEYYKEHATIAGFWTNDFKQSNYKRQIQK